MTKIYQTAASRRSTAFSAGMNLEVATAIAKEIRRYWQLRGHLEIETWVEPLRAGDTLGEPNGFIVRSNLINGLPPSLTVRQRFSLEEAKGTDVLDGAD